MVESESEVEESKLRFLLDMQCYPPLDDITDFINIQEVFNYKPGTIFEFFSSGNKEGRQYIYYMLSPLGKMLIEMNCCGGITEEHIKTKGGEYYLKVVPPGRQIIIIVKDYDGV